MPRCIYLVNPTPQAHLWCWEKKLGLGFNLPFLSPAKLCNPVVSSTAHCPNVSFRKPQCSLLHCKSALGPLELLTCCILCFHWDPEHSIVPLPHLLCSLTFMSDSFHSQILSGPGRIQVRVNKKLFLWAIGKLVVNYQLQCFKCLMQDKNLCVLRVGGLWELYYFLLSWMWLD